MNITEFLNKCTESFNRNQDKVQFIIFRKDGTFCQCLLLDENAKSLEDVFKNVKGKFNEKHLFRQWLEKLPKKFFVINFGDEVEGFSEESLSMVSPYVESSGRIGSFIIILEVNKVQRMVRVNFKEFKDNFDKLIQYYVPVKADRDSKITPESKAKLRALFHQLSDEQRLQLILLDPILTELIEWETVRKD